MSTKTKRSESAQLTYFVVQAFKAVPASRGKITSDDPIPARDHDHAMRLFERYKPIRAGVVAFRRTGDPQTGEWEDGVIVARHGQISAEAEGMAEADEPDFETGELTLADLKVA